MTKGVRPVPEQAVPERARRHRELQRDVAGVPATGAPARLSDRLVASWQRSEDYGVPLEGIDPSFVGTLDD